VIVYRFIDVEKANYPLWLLLQVLSVPKSSYHDWVARGRGRHDAKQAAEAELVGTIRDIFDASTDTYGSPRMHVALADAGVSVSLRRTAELMREAGIVGLSGRERRTTTTTRADRMAAPFPDLVQRQFTPAVPDTIWYGDITYIWVKDKFWYLSTVIDAATKELLGWSFADHMRTGLVEDALHAAVRRRGQIGEGVIFHSDRGSQYTSADYAKTCAVYGIVQSMGRRGVCYDNAGAESFFATLKRELIDRYVWDNPKRLRVHLFNWVESWYNTRRIHTSIGMRAPSVAYADYMSLQRAA
jgi:transposase InsO family protein